MNRQTEEYVPIASTALAFYIKINKSSASTEIISRSNLYFKIGLSRCVSTGVAWMDGRSRAAGTGKAASCGSLH